MCVLLDEIIGNAYEIFFAQSTDKDRTEDDVLYCSGFISHHQAGFAAIEFSFLIADECNGVVKREYCLYGAFTISCIDLRLPSISTIWGFLCGSNARIFTLSLLLSEIQDFSGTVVREGVQSLNRDNDFTAGKVDVCGVYLALVGFLDEHEHRLSQLNLTAVVTNCDAIGKNVDTGLYEFIDCHFRLLLSVAALKALFAYSFLAYSGMTLATLEMYQKSTLCGC